MCKLWLTSSSERSLASYTSWSNGHPWQESPSIPPAYMPTYYSTAVLRFNSLVLAVYFVWSCDHYFLPLVFVIRSVSLFLYPFISLFGDMTWIYIYICLYMYACMMHVSNNLGRLGRHCSRRTYRLWASTVSWCVNVWSWKHSEAA